MEDVNPIIFLILVIASLILGMLIGNAYGPKFCPVCGEEYPKTVSYCKYDGTELMMKGEH